MWALGTGEGERRLVGPFGKGLAEILTGAAEPDEVVIDFLGVDNAAAEDADQG